MEKVLRRRELRFVTENRLGILSEVTELLAGKRVNIENICAYGVDDKAFFHVIADDNDAATSALRDRGYSPEEAEVVVVWLWDRPGSLALVAGKLREKGVNLQYLYGTTSAIEKRMAAVFSSDNNHQALEDLGCLIADQFQDENA